VRSRTLRSGVRETAPARNQQHAPLEPGVTGVDGSTDAQPSWKWLKQHSVPGERAAGCICAPPLFQHALRVREVGRPRAHAGTVVVDDIAGAAGRRAGGRKARSANMLAGVVKAVPANGGFT